MPFTIIRNDVTEMNTDAIVSCGNSALKNHGGVSGHIYEAASPEVEVERDALGGCAPGEAVVTSGGRLQAKHIIHTVGPIWRGGDQGEEYVLRKCYRSSLNTAAEFGCRSVAIPLIASGRYGYPKAEALEVASGEIQSFLAEHEDMMVSLVVFGTAAFSEGERLFPGIKSYIDDNCAAVRLITSGRQRREQLLSDGEPADTRQKARAAETDKLVGSLDEVSAGSSLDTALNNLEKPFKEILKDLIQKSGKKDSEVYNKANISRQTFNNIWNRPGYKPTKNTVIALAVSLKLDYATTLMLLQTLGYTLSRSDTFDVLITYFIKNRKFDIFDINYALYNYSQPQLGS